MKIFQQLFFLFLLFLCILSCEKDDICIAPGLTSKLIVRFYDATDEEKTKSVDNLYVWAEKKDSIYKMVTTDSIALPLNINATETKYLFSANDVIDTLYLYHINREIFISRSCGYKFNFTLEDKTRISHLWTTDLKTIDTPQVIDNEQAAHIKILH